MRPEIKCRYCKQTDYTVDFQTHWTGMRSQVLAAKVHHTCYQPDAFEYIRIEIRARNEEDAIAKWENFNK